MILRVTEADLHTSQIAKIVWDAANESQERLSEVLGNMSSAEAALSAFLLGHFLSSHGKGAETLRIHEMLQRAAVDTEKAAAWGQG